ncbi:MAG: inositol monophosphatase [Alphaproteobacteria bacterium RIFOXYD12_FULL_60_8]|nr:MAG: inositol monophosphatase [Alphaproteobacteria bacterium RIFOXYD12_FULL_60_8]
MAYLSPLMTIMTKAAQKAGRGLARDFGEVENLQVSKKGTSDFVSAADLRAEQTLHAELKKARPDFGFLMEETEKEEVVDGIHRWIIDPLDGTTNFLHGIPHFAISIALEKAGELVAGLVYNPITDEMYYAEKGMGAYLNDRRLRVSARTRLEESIFATGIPFKGKGGHEPFLKQLSAVMDHSAGVRRFGSAALDLAYVAAGRYEGYWESGILPWDIAAGIVIAKEAGGFITDFAGKADMLTRGEVLAATPDLSRPLADLLRAASA